MKIKGSNERFNKIAPTMIRYSMAMKLESNVPNGTKMKIERCLKDATRWK